VKWPQSVLVKTGSEYVLIILTPIKPNPKPDPNHKIMRLVSPYDSTAIFGLASFHGVWLYVVQNIAPMI